MKLAIMFNAIDIIDANVQYNCTITQLKNIIKEKV